MARNCTISLSVLKVVKTILRDRRFHRLSAIGLVLLIGLILLAWKSGYGIQEFKEDWSALEAFLENRPWLLFFSLVILLGLPVPASALVFLAGTVWGEEPLFACGIVLLAIALNLTWTYWAAAYPGRGIVERWIAVGRFQIPEIPKENDLKMILIFRLTPGFPLFLQNYLLGFFRVPFWKYLIVSMMTTGGIACGVALAGAGVGEGKVAPLITGVGVLVVVAIVVGWVRQRLKLKV